MSLLASKIKIVFLGLKITRCQGVISKHQNYENNHFESKPTQIVLVQGERFVKDGCNVLFDYVDVQGTLFRQCDHRV